MSLASYRAAPPRDKISIDDKRDFFICQAFFIKFYDYIQFDFINSLRFIKICNQFKKVFYVKMKIETIDNLEQSFELMQKENGIVGWYAHELSEFLEYADFNTFKTVVRNARASADQSGFDSDKDFIATFKDGLETYKLTRFAVLLCVMFADDRKPKVARLKVFLSKVQDEVLTSYEIERIKERKNLSMAEKNMTASATKNGLSKDKISWFKDAGFRGMYNMGAEKLKQYKGVDSTKTIYNFMGVDETMANGWRAVLTRGKIENENLKTNDKIIQAAKEAGAEVRASVIKNLGVKPENIPAEGNIDDVKKKMKSSRKSIQSIDEKKSKKKLSNK